MTAYDLSLVFKIMTVKTLQRLRVVHCLAGGTADPTTQTLLSPLAAPVECTLRRECRKLDMMVVVVVFRL